MKFRNVSPAGDLELDYGIGLVRAGEVFEPEGEELVERFRSFAVMNPGVYAIVVEDPADG